MKYHVAGTYFDEMIQSVEEASSREEAIEKAIAYWHTTNYDPRGIEWRAESFEEMRQKMDPNGTGIESHGHSVDQILGSIEMACPFWDRGYYPNV